METQKASTLPSKNPIEWLNQFLESPNPSTKENYEGLNKLTYRTGNLNTLYEIKGKLELLLHTKQEIVNGFENYQAAELEDEVSSESTSSEHGNEYVPFSDEENQ
ncbi:unnamed protein product [Blepharisma stoltei]|uniref:Uncharacterized protein n=1 Tax=Blepharisma stoltei TaxID=1481888 RepID=A0AAU9JMR9_9CILI|nr:unnamed protein product [Blepharisma stoltei]